MADATRYGCKACRRTDLTTTANHKLRKHTANGKRRADDNPYCTGSVPMPVSAIETADHQDAAEARRTAVSAPPNPHRDPLPGGLHENAARAGLTVPSRPEQLPHDRQTCPGCGHAEHSGECRELTGTGAPGDVDECGCLSPGPAAAECDGCGHPQHPADRCTGHTFNERCECPNDLGVPPCEYGDGGKHVFVFGECVCGFEQPGYVAPAPVVAARVTASQSGADVLMGSTPHNAADADGDPMDVLMAEDGPSDGSDKLYRNGRYALPDPVTGQKRTWTRATTMAETLSDLYSLNRWRIRMMLIGLARFPDLLTELQEIDGDGEVGKLDPKIHKNVLNKIGDKAQNLAGAKVPAGWGTRMHGWIERLSRDEIVLSDVEDKYRDEVTAWAAAMQEADLSAVAHLIERRVVVPMYGTAGTFDQVCRVHRSRSIRLGNRIIRLNAGDHIIGDVKSGRDLDYAWGEISIQTSLYAHGARDVGKVARWNPDADTGDEDNPGAWEWEDIGIPAKSIRTDVAVIMHVPVQRNDGPAECTLYWIDLEEGWKAVQLCEAVRDWRKAKGLHMPFSIAEVNTSAPPTVREPSWDERFEAITTKDQGRTVYREWLAAGGNPDSPAAARFRKIMKDRIAQLTESTA
jgi:hypothetical protein